jgi:hypothetical protein
VAPAAAGSSLARTSFAAFKKIFSTGGTGLVFAQSINGILGPGVRHHRLESTADCLSPGFYQVSWREDGIRTGGGHSGTGDGDEGDRVGGDPVAVALKRYEVMVVELAGLQPLDRAQEK